MRRHLVLAAAAWAALVSGAVAQEAGAPPAMPGTTSAEAAAPRAPSAPLGRKIFQRYCVVCHGAQGEGGVGPDLRAITARLSVADIQHQVREPRGTMPRFYPSPVDEVALGDLVAFLSQLR